MKASVTILLAACLLAACGQTGALYLPDEGISTPVEIRPGPVEPSPSTAEPTADREKDQEAPASTPPEAGN